MKTVIGFMIILMLRSDNVALIKCRECGKEMSDRAKLCPNCGIENNFMFCPECDKQLSRKANMCPGCGYSFERNIERKSNNLGLAIAGFVCSAVSLLLINPFGILSILGIIFGGIAVSTNKKENGEAWKAVWSYKNKARGFGLGGLCGGICSLVLYVLNLIFTFV